MRPGAPRGAEVSERGVARARSLSLMVSMLGSQFSSATFLFMPCLADSCMQADERTRCA
jgi:hypothetical protein